MSSRMYGSFPRTPGKRFSGFTLLEVMIAVLIVMVGVLGFAKFQANALAGSQVSKNRAIVVMYAASLASAMLGNQQFWSSAAAPTLVTTSGSNLSDSSGALVNAPPSCVAIQRPTGALCTPAAMAAHEIKTWAASLVSHIPDASSRIACSKVTNKPNECTITIVWSERYVNTGASEATQSSATGGLRQYTLHVVPRGGI